MEQKSPTLDYTDNKEEENSSPNKKLEDLIKILNDNGIRLLLYKKIDASRGRCKLVVDFLDKKN